MTNGIEKEGCSESVVDFKFIYRTLIIEHSFSHSNRTRTYAIPVYSHPFCNGIPIDGSAHTMKEDQNGA